MMFVFLLLFGVVVVLVVGQSTTFPALCSVPTNAAQLGGDSRPFDGYSEDYGSVICSSGVSLQPIAGYVRVLSHVLNNPFLLIRQKPIEIAHFCSHVQ